MEYGLLIFAEQFLSKTEQDDFARWFGDLEFTAAAISNVTDKGTVIHSDPDDDLVKSLKGNQGWHFDSTYMPVQAKGAVFTAELVPPGGGDTAWADMRAAYDALDDATKAKIEDLICEHSLMNSRAKLGFFEFTDDERAMMQPVQQRMVRTHPTTGRKSLYLASHIGNITGWIAAEALCFVNDLMEHATRPEFVYVHEWRENDVLVWDNRQMLHRVRAFDESRKRDMRRTTVAGDMPTVA
jgi:alpha-ketoglutarate-dependent 2,4-dichlorophenoxyacetate dioxygenase